MKKWRLLISVLLSAALLLTLFGCGAEKKSSQEIIEEMILYYGSYGEEADKQVDSLLKDLRKIDAVSADKWESIMNLWRTADSDLTVNQDILPDGLSQEDDLCLVALGFQLEPDGKMKEELKERLDVVISCAEKYPNAYIVCTGGGTASENKAATEAKVMADYLIQNNIDDDRIIVEDQSITTAQNAIYTLDILSKQYPQVSKLAIISSDYHIPTGTLLFGAESTLRAEEAGKEQYEIVSNAAYNAPKGTLSRMFQAGALIELSGDKEKAFDIYYETYDIHSLPKLDQ